MTHPMPHMPNRELTDFEKVQRDEIRKLLLEELAEELGCDDVKLLEIWAKGEANAKAKIQARVKASKGKRK